MNTEAYGFFKVPDSGYNLQLNPKSQAPNLKHQISNKSQISNSKFQTGSKVIVFLFGILNFGHWNLFVFWDLLFGISANSITS